MDRHNNVKVVEDVVLPKVANQLAAVVGPVAVLGKLPIDNVELVVTLAWHLPRQCGDKNTILNSAYGVTISVIRCDLLS